MLLPKVFLIILQYNNSKDTIRCLDSILKTQYLNSEVILIDNASSSEHLENSENYLKNQIQKKISLAQSKVKKCHLIKNESNLGYAGGNNKGIRYAINHGADYIFILNNDITIGSKTLGDLIEAGISDNKAGILAPVTKEGDGINYGGKINWLKSQLKNLKKYDSSPDYIQGSALLIKKRVVEKIGLFDEKYFLYFEDADYSLRAREAGYKLLIIPWAVISHEVSASTKKLGSPLLLRYHVRNSLLLNSKHAPFIYKIFLHPWAVLTLIKQGVKTILKINPKQSSAIRSGVIDFYKNRWGIINHD